jgi:hypothetical protein
VNNVAAADYNPVYGDTGLKELGDRQRVDAIAVIQACCGGRYRQDFELAEASQLFLQKQREKKIPVIVYIKRSELGDLHVASQRRLTKATTRQICNGLPAVSTTLSGMFQIDT